MPKIPVIDSIAPIRPRTPNDTVATSAGNRAPPISSLQLLISTGRPASRSCSLLLIAAASCCGSRSERTTRVVQLEGCCRKGSELGARNGFAAVRLNYRHVNQGENYRTVAMEMREQAYRAMIPEEYTESEFDLQYYFELDGGKRGMTMYPGLGPDLTGQPYFVVQQA